MSNELNKQDMSKFITLLRNRMVRADNFNTQAAKELHGPIENEPQRQYRLGRRDQSREILEMMRDELGLM
jgi:hypothetical protein